MRPSLLDSILVRTGLILLAVLLLAGAASLALGMHASRARLEQQSVARLGQLLDTVESTARVACFTRDETLAAELAAGLLKNSEVWAVTILADDRILANQQRGPDAGQAEPADDAPRGTPLMREIHSPFMPELSVGRILLTPDHALIDDAMRRELRRAMLQMLPHLLSVALATLIAMLLLITRPIKAISDALHTMDPTRGERLAPPAGHRRSEIGLLVADVNRLAERLVQALDDEHALRLLRELDERRYHAIFENAETGIFLLDTAGLLTSWNPACARLLGLPPCVEDAETPALPDLGWSDPSSVRELLRRCLAGTQTVAADLPHGPNTEPERWLRMLLTPIDDHAVQGILHDVTPHKEAETAARRLAVTDPLTGLANRLGLDLWLHDLAREHDGLPEHGPDRGFALILIDIDEFRRVNEGFGPAIGDRVLKLTGNRLRASLKRGDFLARPGADQFIVVLPGLTGEPEISNVSERILRALNQPYQVAGSSLRLRISLGIAVYPRDAEGDCQTLFLHAELALAQIKREGGNGAQRFDPLLAAATERRRRLENDLRQAIRDGQFMLFYQPIVDIQANALVGAEALIRWRHPERGRVAPDEFIPLAEETGLIEEIGRWALDTAARQLVAWHRRGESWILSLNVSARQIPNGLPPDILEETARHWGFEPRWLALEITEGVLLAETGETLTWLTRVRDLGFPIYLDDFGTGYSSLSYLKRFPVDRLKVDKSFVRDLEDSPGDQTLVEAILAMAGSLGLAVVAEGVEDAAQLALLRRMGCRYVQGYLFSPPVASEDFDAVRQRIPGILAADPVGA